MLPARDEQLATAERFLTRTLAGIPDDADRRLVHAYATWRVLRRLRSSAEQAHRERSYTRHAHLNITAAVELLNWLGDHGTTLNAIGPGDIEDYLTGATARYQVRDFLHWAAASGHAHPLTVPTPGRTPGKAASSDERWAQIARLLHDDDHPDHRPGRRSPAAALRPATLPHRRAHPRPGQNPLARKYSSASAGTTCTSPNPSPGS